MITTDNTLLYFITKNYVSVNQGINAKIMG